MNLPITNPVAAADQFNAAAREGYKVAAEKLAESVAEARARGLGANPDSYAVLALETLRRFGSDKTMVAGMAGLLTAAVLQLAESGADGRSDTSVNGAHTVDLSTAGASSGAGVEPDSPGAVPPDGVWRPAKPGDNTPGELAPEDDPPEPLTAVTP